MRALHVNASPHGAASHAHRLAGELIASLRESHGPRATDFPLIVRDLAQEPPPAIDKAYASAITMPPGSKPDAAALAWSERLIRELEETSLLVISTPMHNFTVPASLKLWIDYVLRIHRTFAATPAGKVGLLRDRPTFVLVGSGGHIAGERARQPDFLTPYLRHALAAIGIHDVKFVLLQGLVFGDTAVAEALAAARTNIAAELPRLLG
ncbi:FMN-dependent NADH-azoreductase [Cupriavidus sp. 2TAF22]|uniref:FMN-dependent NADH-azoreductase n=1 Tax=unclassified Cupriavidus TaxID=2640874 RepID=UPI003F8DEE21